MRTALRCSSDTWAPGSLKSGVHMDLLEFVLGQNDLVNIHPQPTFYSRAPESPLPKSKVFTEAALFPIPRLECLGNPCLFIIITTFWQWHMRA